MKKPLLFISVCILIIYIQTLSFACWGFRPMGMGGVFVAIADDANAAYWNRAGLGMLDDWEEGRSQIVITERILDSTSIMNRTPRSGNQYYDSVNYAIKINDNMGWGLSASLSGGNAFAISPGIGIRLPWNDKMAIGLGYYLFRVETYDTIGGVPLRADIILHQMHLDYLWKFHPEWSFGVHCENFWRIAGNETSPDDPTININIPGSFWNDVNLRPAIAWMPQGDLKGLVVNAGIYNLLAKTDAEGPFFSAGAEYTLQPKTIKIQVKEKTQYIDVMQEKLVEIKPKKAEPKEEEAKKKKLRAFLEVLNKKIIKARKANNTKKLAMLHADKKAALAHLEKIIEPPKPKFKIVKTKIRKAQDIYKEMAVKENNFWTRSTFRAGMYNYKMDVSGLVTIGYSYRYNDDLEVGYWGGATLLGGSATVHNFGVAYKF